MSTLSENQETLSAHQTIHTFFDIYILSDAISLLQSITKAAGNNKVWQKGYPYTAVHFIKQLQLLSQAAFYLQQPGAQQTAAIIPAAQQAPKPAIELLQAATGMCTYESFWNSFTRSLSLKQFYNPYKAIKKFCRYQTQEQWQQSLEDILEFALVGMLASQVDPECDLLNLQHHLGCLIEACHLIELRINN